MPRQPTRLPSSLRAARGVAWAANVRNNAEAARADRRTAWAASRKATWAFLEPELEAGARVAVVGAGNADDIPLERIARVAAHVDLIDIDLDAALRGASRLPAELRGRVALVEQDVTAGGADRILGGVRRGWGQARRLPRVAGPLGSGDYDLVVADLVYTQLLHPGLTALDLPIVQQRRLMERWDRPLSEALVQRLHKSVREGGSVAHLHDLACWSDVHVQPMPIERALEHPDEAWQELARHDGCDPLLAAQRLGFDVARTAWWAWPFQPDKQFLVRGVVTRASGGHGASPAAGTDPSPPRTTTGGAG